MGQVPSEKSTGGKDTEGVVVPNDNTSEDFKVGSTNASQEEYRTPDGDFPSEVERSTLRKVAASVPNAAWAIALVEFAERASYYGCSGLFNNFIQRPLPAGGNGAGATPAGTQLTPGALGKGIQVATAVTTSFSFLSYTLPILGAILADTKFGRYKMIVWGTVFGFVAHVILVIAALPKLLQNNTEAAFGIFMLSIMVLAVATGFIKSSVAPLMAEQSPYRRQVVKTLATGERVIIDPGLTTNKILMSYYWAINVGAFIKIGTVYAEKRIGFWLGYLVPAIIYLIMPPVLYFVRPYLIEVPPKGSVVLDAGRVIKSGLANGGVRNAVKAGDAWWDAARPDNVERAGKTKPTYDSDFVDEIRRTLKACKLFLFLPILYLGEGLGTITTSQGASMTTNGAPNDLLGSWNPLTIIIATPILNYGLYPYLRKRGIKFGPVRRIMLGFFCMALSTSIGAILQWRVYETSPCGYHASNCKVGTGVSPIPIWAQLPIYSLPAIAELFAVISCYEVAYTWAPQRMKGLIFALVLFTNALSSAIILIVSPSFGDPNLIWPFVGITAGIVIAIVFIWIYFRHMDDVEAEVSAVGTDREIEDDPHFSVLKRNAPQSEKA